MIPFYDEEISDFIHEIGYGSVLGSLSSNQYYHGESTWESFIQPQRQTVYLIKI